MCLPSGLVAATEETEEGIPEAESVVADPEEAGSVVSVADEEFAVPVTVEAAAAACSKSAEAEAGIYQ